jgi:hypothetical protein
MCWNIGCFYAVLISRHVWHAMAFSRAVRHHCYGALV